MASPLEGNSDTKSHNDEAVSPGELIKVFGYPSSANESNRAQDTISAVQPNENIEMTSSHVGGSDQSGAERVPLNGRQPPTSNLNTYQRNKNLAHGFMDLALLLANFSQLRSVLESSMHPYYYFNITCITLSILFQVAMGLSLILNSQCNMLNKNEVHKAITINKTIIINVFLTAFLNAVISIFAVTPIVVQVTNTG